MVDVTCFYWSMDGLGVLRAPAVEELVPSFPDRNDGGHEVKCRKWEFLRLSLGWMC